MCCNKILNNLPKLQLMPVPLWRVESVINVNSMHKVIPLCPDFSKAMWEKAQQNCIEFKKDYQNRSTEPKSSNRNKLRKERESKNSRTIKKKIPDRHKSKKPSKEAHPVQYGRKRFVIIDGCNVGYAHHRDNGNARAACSAPGIALALEYFRQRGNLSKAVVPDFRVNPGKTTDYTVMQRLQNNNKLLLTPTKDIPGLKCMSYDDRVMLQIAHDYNAAVVTNDRFRDLKGESLDFQRVIESRVLPFNWEGHQFQLIQFPYGTNGLSADQILDGG